MERNSIIALDVGGSSVKSTVVAPEGTIVGGLVITSVESTGNHEAILSTFTGVVEAHLRQVLSAQLLGVALGFPGPFDYMEGVSLVAGVEKFGAIYGVNLRQALRSRLGLGDLRILFRNDAEAAIVGEACYGAGKPYNRLIGVTLGTGCGSAFIADGLPIATGPVVPPSGWLYSLPFRGQRADDLFSRRGIEARLKAAGAGLTDVKAAAEAARAGDEIIRQIFTAFGADLGEFLDSFARSFQAEAVLVLGQIAGALDLFGPALSSSLSVPALGGKRGPEAALLGAADLFYKQCQEAT